jgi:excinuclease UvrABC helicase subunit UvrB
MSEAASELEGIDISFNEPDYEEPVKEELTKEKDETDEDFKKRQEEADEDYENECRQAEEEHEEDKAIQLRDRIVEIADEITGILGNISCS